MYSEYPSKNVIKGECSLGNICVVVPVNNSEILTANLLRSPVIRDGLPVKEMRNYRSAAVAYNTALDETSAEIVVLVHQDVYLPGDWTAKLQGAIRVVEAIDRNWAVMGVYGVKADGTQVGKVWCSCLRRELVTSFSSPVAVVSVDELLIVLRRNSGLRFDEGLPGFHLYGTDIVQTARQAGLGAYVVDAPVIHNTLYIRSLLGPYAKASRYMARKWRKKLPLLTLNGPVTRWGGRMFYSELQRLIRHLIHGLPPVESRPDPIELAHQLGYE